MKFLFLHRNFPAQFRDLATHLAHDSENTVVYITNRREDEIPHVKKYIYEVHREVKPETHHYLRYTEDAVLHGQGALRTALKLQEEGFYPDVIFAHSWGPASFMKDVFPKAKLVAHVEWFYHSGNSDVDFAKVPDIDVKAKIRYKNSHILVDMYSCDHILTPTEWQFEQIPQEFRAKTSIIHEGINTDYFVPNDEVVFEFEDKKFTRQDEIITYATRGMEPYRGFPQFMEAASIIQKRRPNAHIIVAGQDRICYGGKTKEEISYKNLMLEKYEFDHSRLHFVGTLPYFQYMKILQVSSAHVYLTYPFVLSWSMLEAMSCGAVLIASNTRPVTEVVMDETNGLLVDFFNTAELADKLDLVLNNRENYEYLRTNARKTIIKNFNQKDMIQKQLDLINQIHRA